MKTLIKAISLKHHESGIELYPPVTPLEIETFERKMGFALPADFRELYLICDGFSCNEDIFRLVPLSKIRQDAQDYGINWFYFAEYMIYSDMWGLRFNALGQYEIFNGSYPDHILTTSLYEFLNRFLQGNVFDSGGLYDWNNDI